MSPDQARDVLLRVREGWCDMVNDDDAAADALECASIEASSSAQAEQARDFAARYRERITKYSARIKALDLALTALSDAVVRNGLEGERKNETASA